MSVTADTSAFGFGLESADKMETARIARELCSGPYLEVDSSEWVTAVRHASEALPVTLRQQVREFRRHAGPRGAILIRNLPVDEETLPRTPMVEGSVQRKVAVPAAVLMLIACQLGDPTAFEKEKSGALVQDVVPVPGKEEFQGNAGSVLLSFHNENAFHQHRPDYLMLLCLRSDHEKVAGLRIACVREVLPELTVEARKALFRSEFVTNPPPSFGMSGGATPPHPVLFGVPEDPDVRVDLAATVPTTTRAKSALLELQELFDRCGHTLQLHPGDLAIVDNRLTVHGRTAFRPRYDGWDRWLQRTFVAADLRRSRAYRPSDGYVLAS